MKLLIASFLFLSSVAATGVQCKNFLHKAPVGYHIDVEDVLVLVIKADEVREKLYQEQGSDSTRNQNILDLADFIERKTSWLLDNVSSVNSMDVFTKVTELVDSASESIELSLELFSKTQKNKDALDSLNAFSLLDDPSKIIADEYYDFPSMDRRVLGVKFNAKVVENLFKAKDDIRRIAARKFLKAIQTGIVNGNSGTSAGIRVLTDFPGIYEIKITGRRMKFRLGAYLSDHRTLNVVHYTDDSNHSSRNYRNRFVEAVNRAQMYDRW